LRRKGVRRIITGGFEDGGTMTTKARAWRIAATVVAALLIPACGSEDTPSIVFLEQFGKPFPGTDWTVPAATGSATAVKDVLNGHTAAPSLRLSASSIPSTITTETTASFNNPSVTISVHMAADDANGTDGTGTITIRNNVDAVVASASWDETTGVLTVAIGATTMPVATPAADLNFHRIVFTVSPHGTASWKLDNQIPLLSAPGFAAGLLTVELGATFQTGATWASFYFDNIVVTTP
jgi:hypothetical protein